MPITPQYAGNFISSQQFGVSGSIPVVGYQGTAVAEEYIVTILSAQSNPATPQGGPIVVRAILQEEVRMGVGSTWDSFIGIIGKDGPLGLLEIGAQAFFNRSLQNSMTSRRIWTGTKPISLTLALRFEEEQQASKEVMQACEALQCMCLPGASVSNDTSLLVPPGPSPFDNNLQSLNANSELIAVYVGRALSFVNVIIKKVDVMYQTRMGTDGFFKAAKVLVEFETYEIVTKNKIRSTSSNDSGIYSTVAINNQQRYNASLNALAAAAGFKVASSTTSSTKVNNGSQPLTGSTSGIPANTPTS